MSICRVLLVLQLKLGEFTLNDDGSFGEDGTDNDLTEMSGVLKGQHIYFLPFLNKNKIYWDCLNRSR